MKILRLKKLVTKRVLNFGVVTGVLIGLFFQSGPALGAASEDVTIPRNPLSIDLNLVRDSKQTIYRSEVEEYSCTVQEQVGSHTECRMVDRQECNPTSRRECHTAYRQDCDQISRRECDWVERRDCDPITRRECSEERVCHNEPSEVCRTDPNGQRHCTPISRRECSTERVCRDVRDEVCRTDRDYVCRDVRDQVCRDIPYESCQDVIDPNCRNWQEQVCEEVPDYRDVETNCTRVIQVPIGERLVSRNDVSVTVNFVGDLSLSQTGSQKEGLVQLALGEATNPTEGILKVTPKNVDQNYILMLTRAPLDPSTVETTTDQEGTVFNKYKLVIEVKAIAKAKLVDLVNSKLSDVNVNEINSKKVLEFGIKGLVDDRLSQFKVTVQKFRGLVRKRTVGEVKEIESKHLKFETNSQGQVTVRVVLDDLMPKAEGLKKGDRLKVSVSHKLKKTDKPTNTFGLLTPVSIPGQEKARVFVGKLRIK